MAARKRATARTAVLPARRGLPSVGRIAPSGRSILLGLLLLAAAAGAYLAARDTSVFAVQRLDVAGGSPRIQAEVRAALAGEVGRSLLRVNGDDLDHRLAGVPDVISIRYDRAFPHTLRVVVRAERPVLLLRRGVEGWIVSARGRVLRQVQNPRLSSLPRLYVTKDVAVVPGALLGAAAGGRAAAALAPLGAGGFPGHVQFVRASDKELTLVLRTHVEVRLGDDGDLRLKYAIARRILAATGSDPSLAYVDVSVPERPVTGTLNPQVGG